MSSLAGIFAPALLIMADVSGGEMREWLYVVMFSRNAKCSFDTMVP
jgi:hypothetical protein